MYQKPLGKMKTSSNSSKSHACRFKSFQFWARSKDCVILICFAKRMEGNGHSGPEKSGSKVPKNPAKTPIGHANSLCSVRSKFHAQCALRISKSNSPCMRSPCMSNCPLAIGVLAGFFGTLKPDFSGPKWPLPSILFAKHLKMTQSFERAQNWNDLKRHASQPLL